VPVVALETAVLTHGLPRTPFSFAAGAEPPGWDPGSPANLATVRVMEKAVRAGGAVPATIAVIEGTLRVGLDAADLERLALAAQPRKASSCVLGHVLVEAADAGTTVSGTLAACRAAGPPAIRVLATGGIGGVHRGWSRRPDVSADLTQLAATPACVVCAGAKSVLDVPATAEWLETLRVPVIGFGTDRFPLFHSPGPAPGEPGAIPLRQRVDDAATAAAVCRNHWQLCGTGIVLAVPVPADAALDAATVEEAVRTADALAAERGVAGPDLTPFLLAQLARLTDGRSLAANIALLVNNARVGAEVAAALASAGPVEPVR